MPRSWSRIGGWRLKYEQIPIRKVYNVLNRGMVLLRDVFSLNEYNFLKMISSNNSLPFMFDVYYGNESLLNLMQKNYEVGYRLFISTHGSFALKEIFDWLLTKQPPQYLAHDNLLKAGVDSEEKAIIVLEILRRSKIQSYDHTLDFLYSTCYLSTSGTIISIMDGFEEWTRNGNSANIFVDDFFTTKFTPGFKTI